MADLQVDIVTPEKLVFSGIASEVLAPGWDGQFDVLQGHAHPYQSGPQCDAAEVVNFQCQAHTHHGCAEGEGNQKTAKPGEYLGPVESGNAGKKDPKGKRKRREFYDL